MPRRSFLACAERQWGRLARRCVALLVAWLAVSAGAGRGEAQGAGRGEAQGAARGETQGAARGEAQGAGRGEAQAAARGEAQRAARAWLGVQTHEIAGALVVRRVARRSPALRAQLAEGDVLLAAGGERLAAPSDLARHVATRAPGEQLVLRLRRAAGEREVAVELVDYPGADEVARRMLVGTRAADLDGTEPVHDRVATKASVWRGKVVLLEHFAASCASCERIAETLAAWHRERGPRGLTVVGIAGDDPRTALAAVKSWGIPYGVVADPEGVVAARYAVTAVPTLVLVDRRGIVAEVVIGYSQASLDALDRKIAQLVAAR